MFAGDGPAPGQHLPEELIQRGFRPGLAAGLRAVEHDVDVDVAVAGVAESSHRQAVPGLQLRAELEKIFQPPAGHHDILVELGQAGVAERIGKLAPELPKLFAGGTADGPIDKDRFP